MLAAFFAGAAVERVRATAAFAQPVQAGHAVIRGGKRGALATHGNVRTRDALRDAWRERFAALRRRFPDAPKKTLLGMIEDETGASQRTLRRHITQR